MQLDNARILVTGATGGIGENIARQLSMEGATLILHGRDSVALTALATELEGAGTSVATVAGDLTLPADRMRIVDESVRMGVNVLVNNAGIGCFGAFENTDVAAIIETNVVAAMELTRNLLPHLRQRDESLIMNLGSTFGTIGFPGYVAYCASKHAIKGFSEALKRELADTSIQVLYLAPRATETKMNDQDATKMNRIMGVSMDSPRLVGKRVVAAMRKGRSREQLGWPEKLQVKVNGLIPGLVDRALAARLPVIKPFIQRIEDRHQPAGNTTDRRRQTISS